MEKVSINRNLVPGLIINAVLVFLIAFRITISGRINPETIYLVNAVLASLILLILVKSSENLKINGKLIWWGIAVYFGASFLSVFFSISTADSFRWFIFHSGDLLLFIAVVLTKKHRTITVVTGILTGGFITSAWALRQNFGGLEAALALEGLSDYAIMTIKEGRVFGLTSSPDMLAAILSGLLPVCLSLLAVGFKNREYALGRTSLLIASLLLLLFCAVIYLTMSIGGILSAFIGISCWAFITVILTGNRKTIKVFITGIIISIIFAAFILGYTIQKRGGTFFDLEHHDNPIVMRLDNWMTGLLVWKEFPLTGAGGGQHSVAVLLHKRPQSNEAKHAHNTFIEVLSETGPAGFLGLLMVAFGFLSSGYRSLQKEYNLSESEFLNSNELIPGIFCGGIAVFTHSMIDYDWTSPEVTTIFWVSAAGVATCSAKSLYENKSKTYKLFKFLTILVLSVIFALQLYCFEGERRRQKAISLAREGQWPKAFAASQKALSWDNTSSHMWSLKAVSMSRISPAKDRTQQINNAIRLNPRYPYNYRDLGRALINKDKKAAQKAFLKAVSLYPNNYNLNLNLGTWQAKQNDLENAKITLHHAIECSINNHKASLELGRIYILQKNENEAKKYFLQAAGSRILEAHSAIGVSRWIKSKGHGKTSYSFLKTWAASHPESRGLEDVKTEIKTYLWTPVD